MAQLVARDFWEVEAAGSSPVTQTRFTKWTAVSLEPALRPKGQSQFKSSHPDQIFYKERKNSGGEKEEKCAESAKSEKQLF